MKRIYTRMLAVGLLFSGFAQAQSSLWKNVKEESIQKDGGRKTVTPNKYQTLSLELQSMKQLLQSAPMEFTPAASNAPIIEIPMSDGSITHFRVVQSPMMEQGLADKFPEIKTYSGQGIEDQAATLKLDVTPYGFHAMVLSPGSGSTFVDPYYMDDVNTYLVYNKKDLTPKPFIELEPEKNEKINSAARTQAGFCVGTVLRVYRLAVSNTGEYAAALSATTTAQVLANITTTINRVNAIYEKELSIRLTLVANNNLIIYTNSTTDPYTGNNNANTLINQSQSNITSVLGSSAFDVGHTFSTGAGGLAGLGVVCDNSSKGRGVTGSSAPLADAYDVDYVAHELGHQFGAPHTFNGTTGSCSGNASTSSNVEPGSGTTIMAYAGICTGQDLQSNSDPQFHAISRDFIMSYVISSATCNTSITTGNTIPTVDAGSDFTIPVNTPFVLTGSASDGNGDPLTYSWEQMNTGGPLSAPTTASGNAPISRSYAPVTTPTRYFPRLKDVVNYTTTLGDRLPTYARTLNYRLTARDNRNGGGGVCADDVVVTVSGSAGPFNVTSQLSDVTWTANGSNTTTITWSVNNTNIAPINATTVDIMFSADGGESFPYKIAAATANDGSETIVIPSIPTTKGRLMVKATNNVFYNVNGGYITIQSGSCAAEGAVIRPNQNVTGYKGSSTLNLNLAPQYNTALSIAGTINTDDPVSFLTYKSGSTCGAAANSYRYESFQFIPSVTGSYTFTITGPYGLVMNLYSNTFQSGSPCTNYINTSATLNGSSISIASTVTASLTAGSTYILNVGTFSNALPTLPATYSVAVTEATGGFVYAPSGAAQTFTNPGGSYSYGYVVVNNATGNITAISSTADLTNVNTFAPGVYTVYGISYATSITSTLQTYVGTSFATFANTLYTSPATLCGNLSKNNITVTITAVDPTPVSFLGLKARKQDSRVALDWSTASEINTSYFVVERSANGNSFETQVTKVAAKGAANAVTPYAVADANPINGKNYYRVKAVDKDGLVTYSNIAAVDFSKAAASIVVYPNPAKDKVTIEYTSTRNNKVQVQLVDAKGSVIVTRTEAIVTGINNISLNTATLSKGVYILRVIDEQGNTSFQKLIKE